MADRTSAPTEVLPPSPRRYWTRRGVAEWLVERLSGEGSTLVGIDHAFSFPVQFFMKYNLRHDWPAFLDDFQQHWPTDEDNTYVDFVCEGAVGNGNARTGDSHWRRITEIRAGAAKSVFQFEVQGAVAKSAHSGLPWLRCLRQKLGTSVQFWPFDGWEIPPARSVIVEVYSPLWSRDFAREGRGPDQHDAYSVAAWMRRSDLDGTLAEFFKLDLTDAEREMARTGGWILGVR